MRMGPFSNARVIRFLNQSFVPVLVSTEEYVKRGTKSLEERELLQAIFRSADEQELSRGTVHVYMLNPQGELLHSMHVREATDQNTLMRLLRSTMLEVNSRSGEKLIHRDPNCRQPQPRHPDSVVLKIAAEYTHHPGTVGEDWVQLSRSEWQCFAPAPGSQKDSAPWNIDAEIAKKILVHLYPFSQDWDTGHNQFLACELVASELSRSESGFVIAVRGQLLMKHNRYTNRTPETVSAEIVGTVRFEQDQLPTFKLTTGQANYGGRPFDGLVINAPVALGQAAPTSTTSTSTAPNVDRQSDR